MCQAYEAEQTYVISSERKEIRQKLKDYVDGKVKLTDEEVHTLQVKLFMLNN